jgi:signal transduction histidine kinase
MTDIPDSDDTVPQDDRRLNFIENILLTKTRFSIRSPHLWIIIFLIAGFAYLYYGVLTDFHDIFAILYFYPLIYAVVIYRWRGVMVGGLIFLGILLPHALFISSEPYALLRSLIFALFAVLTCSLVAAQLNLLERQLAAYRDISILNDELNKHIEQLERTQRQLIQSEKLNAIGQLAASVAHEINNPLAGVLVYAKLISKKLSGDNFDKEETLNNLNKIEMAVNHCSRIIRSLLDFSRQTEPSLQPVMINDIIDDVMSLVGHQAEMNHVAIDRNEDSSLPPIMADAVQLKQVFVNLIVNAIQAMPEGGQLNITSTSDNNSVSISFRDTGSGIDSENMDKLFTPFFTTKQEVSGVGLGLAVSYGIIERHNGRIEVQSKVGDGSTFTVHLPICEEADS